MEALLCKRLGDPTSSSEPPIELTQNHPIPKLDSPTAVRIKIKATSLTFATYLKILGKYQEKHPLPFIPGSDYAGTVDAVGPSVTKFKVGDYVCAVSPIGSFASFIVQDQSRLFEVPKGCDLVAAAGLPVAFGTSHLALVHRANLTSSQVHRARAASLASQDTGDLRGFERQNLN